MKLADKYPDLKPILKGSSFNQLFEWFFKLAQLRYATKDHLNFFNNKLGTKKKLRILADMGFLSFTDNDYFFTGPKTLELLEKEGFQRNILQDKFTGQAGKHQQELSSVIFKTMKDPSFYRCFYPVFNNGSDNRYLIPDACLVFRDGEKVKIEFLEVENEKPEETWKSHLLGKHEKYQVKAKQYEMWEKWWTLWSKKLNLPLCKVEDFCFSVRCVGGKNFGYDWEGWKFE